MLDLLTPEWSQSCISHPFLASPNKMRCLCLVAEPAPPRFQKRLGRALDTSSLGIFVASQRYTPVILGSGGRFLSWKGCLVSQEPTNTCISACATKRAESVPHKYVLSLSVLNFFLIIIAILSVFDFVIYYVFSLTCSNPWEKDKLGIEMGTNHKTGDSWLPTNHELSEPGPASLCACALLSVESWP